MTLFVRVNWLDVTKGKEAEVLARETKPDGMQNSAGVARTQGIDEWKSGEQFKAW